MYCSSTPLGGQRYRAGLVFGLRRGYGKGDVGGAGRVWAAAYPCALHRLPANLEDGCPETVGCGEVMNMQISLSNLSHTYDGTHRVFHGISFELRDGTALALTGPSGSGKSTLMTA